MSALANLKRILHLNQSALDTCSLLQRRENTRPAQVTIDFSEKKGERFFSQSRSILKSKHARKRL